MECLKNPCPKTGRITFFSLWKYVILNVIIIWHDV